MPCLSRLRIHIRINLELSFGIRTSRCSLSLNRTPPSPPTKVPIKKGITTQNPLEANTTSRPPHHRGTLLARTPASAGLPDRAIPNPPPSCCPAPRAASASPAPPEGGAFLQKKLWMPFENTHTFSIARATPHSGVPDARELHHAMRRGSVLVGKLN